MVKKYYISREIIDNIKDKQTKEEGTFSLLPILAGIAAGSVSGGAAGIANAVQDKQAHNAQKAHDNRVEQLQKGEGMFLPEYQKGNGLSGVKAFVDKTGLDVVGKKLRKTLKPLSNKLNIIVKGDDLILTPKL